MSLLSCILKTLKKILTKHFWGSRKDTLWFGSVKNLFFPQIYSSLSPNNPRLYKQNDDS